MSKNTRTLFTMVIVLTALSILTSNCAPSPTVAPTSAPTQTVVTKPTLKPDPTPQSSPTIRIEPTPSSIPLPKLPQYTLKPGENYFSVDGQPSFLLSRNITAKNQAGFDTLLDWAHQGGTKVIRIHIISGWGVPWINPDWTVNEKMAQYWDNYFDQAQALGIYIIPVFGVWADWNSGMPADVYHFWQYNPLNAANGGPLTTPTGLFESDSDTQKHWMGWVKTLVERWQGRENIAAWEIFSEINLATGVPGDTDAKGAVSVTSAIDFTNKAAAMIREVDPNHHLVTVSLAGSAPFTNEWGVFYEQNTLDFIEIHPYYDQLDRALVEDVKNNLERYHKPVMIGESGLWSADQKENAPIGIQHAIWAGLVSGAMNGRALWWNDGYAFYSFNDRNAALQEMQKYATIEQPVANFVDGIDFSGFAPLKSVFKPRIWGAAIGNEEMILGWYRDSSCEPPNWNLTPVPAGQKVTIILPGTAENWQVDFYDTQTGTNIISSAAVTRDADKLTVILPDFIDSIAFKLHSVK